MPNVDNILRETPWVHQFVVNCCISGVAAAFSKTLVAPIERSKLIIQNQTSSIQVIRGEVEPFKGIIDILRRVPREQGMLSLWRGNSIAVMRYFPLQSLNFAFYDYYKSVIPDSSGSLYGSYFHKFVSGIAAGSSAGIIIYPIESCQTRFALDFGADSTATHKLSRRVTKSLLQCLRKIYRRAGFTGLYRGAKMAVSGIALYRGLYFSLFETFKSVYWELPLDSNEIIATTDKHVLVNLVLAQSATAIAGATVYPFDTVGRRFMLDAGRRPSVRLYKNTTDTIKSIYRYEGILGFYKGVGVNILRGSAGAFVLVLYDEVLFYTNWKSWLRNNA